MRARLRPRRIPEALTRDVIRKGLSVRQTEEQARREKNARGPGADIGRASARNAAKAADADIEALERQLGDILGLKVQVTNKGQGGVVDAPLFEPRPARHGLPAPLRRADLGAAARPARDRQQLLGQGFLFGRVGEHQVAARARRPALKASPDLRRVHRCSIRSTDGLSFQNKALPNDAMTASTRSPRSIRARAGASISSRR